MRWVIVLVHSRKAKSVAEEIDGWVPVEERWTKPSRKRKPVISQFPIFPGWVFRPYDDEFYHIGLRKVLGVKGVLKAGKHGPMMLRKKDMDRLMVIEQELRLDPEKPDQIRELPVVEPGDRVGISGLVEGLTGTVISVSSGYAEIDVGGNFPIKTSLNLLKLLPS